MKTFIGSPTRSTVIENAVFVEKFVSQHLSYLLGIDVTESKSLGNSSDALSFKDKVTILLDLGAIKPDDKSKFLKFVEIRNQFAHNYDVKDFKSYFSLNSGNGTLKFLSKLYLPDNGQNIQSDEEKYEFLYNKLYADVVNLCTHTLLAYVVRVLIDKQDATVKSNLTEALIETLSEYKDIRPDLKDLLNSIYETSTNKTFKTTKEKNPYDKKTITYTPLAPEPINK